MKEVNHKPNIGTGFLTGLLLALALTAILYAGAKLTGLLFIPFALFDRITQILPGKLLTATIDTMVQIIGWLNIGNTSEAAKTAEKTIAIINFILTLTLFAVFYFLLMRVIKRKKVILYAVATGTLSAVGMLVFFLNDSQSSLSGMSVLWIIGSALLWGAALGYVYTHLNGMDKTLYKEERITVNRIDRRRFMVQLGAAVAVVSVSGVIVGKMVGKDSKESNSEDNRWSSDHPLPNADAAVMPAPGTRPEFTPLDQHYRIDINTAPPIIDEKSWRLKIKGLVKKPVDFTLDDIRHYPALHQFVTLACISNPIAGDLIGTTRWTGVSLQKLLPLFELLPNATHLKITAADGFHECISLEEIRRDERIMLTYAWDGVPLQNKHGFPLRIYIPNIYGMKQPKWIESIEALDHWEEGYWVARGWDKYAIMKTTSVIDTIASERKIITSEGKKRIPIGGIAHAGARGISKVEIKVDNNPWEATHLRDPLSSKTWVLWRYDWPFKEGTHTFTVRCFDGNGILQITEESKPHPSGASGLHKKQVSI